MNTSQLDRYTLKQYSRLIISFFGCLLVMSIYQYTTLYFKGVVDIIFGSSFFIALVHQIGYASIVGLILLFPFNFWENLRPRYGFYLVFVLLLVLLVIEALLISYYCVALVPLGSDLLGYSWADITITVTNSGGIWIVFFLFFRDGRPRRIILRTVQRHLEILSLHQQDVSFYHHSFQSIYYDAFRCRKTH